MLLNQIVILQSKYHKEVISTDSIFKSSIVQVWWACVNFDTYYTYSYQYYIETYHIINNCTFILPFTCFVSGTVYRKDDNSHHDFTH